MTWLLVAIEFVSFLCLIHLWRRKDAKVRQKVLWSFIMVIPILGPLFYGSSFRGFPEGRDSSGDDGMPIGGSGFH